MDNWEWPQYTLAALYVLNMVIHSYLHDERRTGNFSGPSAVIGSIGTIFILYCGGFWS